jgi:hypothetical protein
MAMPKMPFKPWLQIASIYSSVLCGFAPFRATFGPWEAIQ